MRLPTWPPNAALIASASEMLMFATTPRNIKGPTSYRASADTSATALSNVPVPSSGSWSALPPYQNEPPTRKAGTGPLEPTGERRIGEAGELPLLPSLADALLGGEPAGHEPVQQVHAVAQARRPAMLPTMPTPMSRQVVGMTSLSKAGRSTPLKVVGSWVSLMIPIGASTRPARNVAAGESV